MAKEIIGLILVITLIVTLTSLAFGGTNPFECESSSDCTMAAIDDLSDFDLGDILLIPQLLPIILGDVIEVISLSAVAGVPDMIRFGIGFILAVGWLFILLEAVALFL